MNDNPSANSTDGPYAGKHVRGEKPFASLPSLEPLGAIGDLGWYDMRAIHLAVQFR